MPKNKKEPLYWSKKLDEAGIRFRLFERPGSSMIWFSTMRDGQKLRRSLDTSSRSDAEDRARALCREIARARLTGVQPHTVTLGQVFALYRKHRLPDLSPGRQTMALTRLRLFEEAWGSDLLADDLGQTHIDRYMRLRMAGELTPDHTRALKAVRAGTVDNDLRFLASVFNVCRRHKVNGKRVLSDNPMHDVTWPREKNVLRPVASHQRFTETLEHVDTVDATGGLRCMLNLARLTGRRESALTRLRASDFLRDADAIRGALASMGFDENRADYMPSGALRWRDENDKQGFSAITALGEAARAALDEYMARSPRMGEAWLFPAPQDDTKPVRRDRAAGWLTKAEKLAGLPKLRGGTWHPYRRLWASERKHMPDVDVAAAGGWRDTRAMKVSYQQADAETQLQVVQAMG